MTRDRVAGELKKLWALERFARDVITRTGESAFRIRSRSESQLRVEPLYLSKHFELIADASTHAARLLPLPAWHCNLFAEAVLTVLAKRGVTFHYAHGLMSDGRLEAEEFNEMLDEVRRVLTAAEFTAEVQRRGRYDERTYLMMSAYFNLLLDRYGKLLVLRLDLYPPKEMQLSQQQLLSTFQQMFHQNLRHNERLNEIVGYVWKREGGDQRGPHLHLFVFLDGNTHRNGWWWANELGMYWQSMFSMEGAHFENCNANTYARNAIGLVTRHDLAKIRSVYGAIGYFAKVEQDCRGDDLKIRRWGCGHV